MADQGALRPIRVSRERTHKIFIDSRDLVSHENNNPSNYSYNLEATIPNVTKVRLLTFRVPYSPTFVVIRSSKWMDSSLAGSLSDMDTFHQKAYDLTQAAVGTDVEKQPRVLTIFKTDGTVSLNVIETFTFIRSRDSDDAFRSYDVFICTGTLDTSSRDDWRLQDPSSEDSATMDLPMTGTAANDAKAYAATDAGSSSVAVNILEENMYLRLDVGQGQGRLNSIRSVYPQWKSFQVYRRGDFVCYNGTCYTCLRNHMSLIFNEDVETFWKSVDTTVRSTAAANDAFYVVETNDPNESVLMATAAYDEIVMDTAPTNVSSIDVEWRTRRGSHFIFPHTTAIEFLSFTDTSNVATLKKQYRHHTLMVELTYNETTEVMARGDVRSEDLDATPSFLALGGGSRATLMPSGGPLRLPSRL